MSDKNTSILQFFKPAQRGSEPLKIVNNAPSESSTLPSSSREPELAKALYTSNTAGCQSETTDIPPCAIEVQPEPLKATAAFNDAPSPSTPPPQPTASVMLSLPNKERPSSQRVIKSSDDEDSESGSDDSLVDLADLLQSRSTTYRPQTTTQKTQTPPRSKSSRSSSNHLTSHLSLQPKNKYRFGLKALVSQSQKHAATEASAQRVQGILDDKSAGVTAGQEDKREAHSSLLGSVITETDGNGVEKVLQAVRRTEATQAEKCWYFFDPQGETPREDPRIFPAECATEPWQKRLVKREDRERCVESGIVKDIVTREEELPEELFLWMLDEVCIESNDNLRRAYCEVLLAAADSIDDYLTPEVVKAMFDNLGALGGSTDLKTRVEAVNVCKRAYEKRNWGALKTVIKFLGDSAQFAAPATCNFSIAILARLCADRLVWDNIGLFSAVQKSMSQLSAAIDDDRWEISCRNLCKYIYNTVPQPSLRLQILRCIPESNPRLHELRRRLAFAAFCSDASLLSQPVQRTFEIWKLSKTLCDPRFTITRQTDYPVLTAEISLLDIALDSGSSLPATSRASSTHADARAESEREFNADVDALAYQLKVLWSSISEVGASFLSRIDAKEAMEGVRNRLLFTVRTRPVPRARIFDIPGRDGGEGRGDKKQRVFMEGHFKRARTGEGGSKMAVGGGDGMEVQGT